MAEKDINIFIDRSMKEQTKLIGKLNHWYRHGTSDEVLEENQLTFIKAVEDAHSMMIDIKNKGDMRIVGNKLRALYNIKSADRVKFILDMADALFNSQQSLTKRYKRQMMDTFLLAMMEECREEKEYKALSRFTEQYIALNKLHLDDDGENPVIEKIIELSADPHLLETYSAENDEEVKKAIEFFKNKSKLKVFGQGD